MTQIFSIKDLPNIAKTILELVTHKNVFFYAKMGAGKTTLIKEIIKQLGVSDNVNSPTFSLVNEYIAHDDALIYHFDFYRINDEQEALDIGIEDYFYKNAWCFIEWPQNIENLLPLESHTISIEIIDEDTRKIKFTTNLKPNI
ncbi:MAG: tRNA (adenosine(37)-N6)-threonylcarbamoyltransferase complex ATPase subunit type 1 TsaE [Flavobacteriaceae bacterium]